MNDWLHNLPIVWMTLVVFGAVYLITAVIYAVVMGLAVGEKARAFKAVSPGMLPPLGILFALFTAFTAAQVWNDTDRANTEVLREASALRAAVILAANFPGEPEAQMRQLIRRHIEEAVDQEWPMMARHTATLAIIPQPLAEAARVTLALTPTNQGQEIAQRGIDAAFENALDARRQRILVSLSQVNLTKWLCLLVQAICMLFAIAMVHSDNWRAVALAMGLFASGVAVSVLLILAHDRPFTGEISAGPAPLLQVLPQSAANQS
jgi:Protein of unknown function (DUF4239)